MVTVFEAKLVANVRREVAAGPVSTRPAESNVDPWHGQTKRPSVPPVITHASWVQVAVIALKEVAPVLATRIDVEPAWTKAREPVAARGEPASIMKVTVLPAREPVIRPRAGADEPLGPVLPPPPPPPQPGCAPKAPPSNAALHTSPQKRLLVFSMIPH
jgi:hypothetical protein